jgi:hypothetical protein
MNNEILQGLKIAVQRGQSLRDAMMSFYNAGYKKQEIEEAARHISISSPVQQKQNSQQQILQKSKQQISKYEEKTKPKSKLTLILLITAIVVLIAILVSIFFFRNELIDFFVNLFK